MKQIPLFRLILSAALCLPFIASAGAETPPPADADQATALAHKLETDINARDNAAAEALFDRNAFLDIVTVDVTVSSTFRATFRDTVNPAPALISAITRAMGTTPNYRVLRVRQIDGHTRALCRALGKTGGVNYNDWVLGHDLAGNPKFVDMYSAASGELVSQTLRRIYISGAAEQNLNMATAVHGKDKTYAANIPRLREMANDYNTGKCQEALDIYNTLPAIMQQQKWVMLIRLNAAGKLKATHPELLDSALADFQKFFPNDPCLDLDELVALIRNKKFDDARASIARLQTFTGGDPYLVYLQGDTYYRQGGGDNLITAEKYFDESIGEEPTLHNPYWGLVEVSLKQKNFDETSAMLDQIVQNLHVRINDLHKAPIYAEYVQSAAYVKWKTGYDATTGAQSSRN